MTLYDKLKENSLKVYSQHAKNVLAGLMPPVFFNSGLVGFDTEVDNYNKPFKKYCLPYVHLIEHYNVDTFNKTILEVGSGFGRGCFFLKNKYNFKSVTGCDINEDVVDVAKQLFKKTKFIVADAVSLQSIGQLFDIVITIETAPYWVCHDLSYASFASVVKKGGSLLIATDMPRDIDIDNQMISHGFKLSGQCNLTDNVLQSLNESDKSKQVYKYRIRKLQNNWHYVSKHFTRE